MPSITTEPVSWEEERGELQAVLQSNLFTRSPTLTHLLSYLCERTFAGESAQIKEYSVTRHFIEHRAAAEAARKSVSDRNSSAAEGRVFNVFCNGKTILPDLNILEQAGENRPLVRRIKGLEPNAQGKLLLEFVPVSRYATVSAIEVVPDRSAYDSFPSTVPTRLA